MDTGTPKHEHDGPVPFLSFNENHGGAKLAQHCPIDEGTAQAILDNPALPLRNTWVLWEQITTIDGKTPNYADATRRVAPFSTVQDFWRIWNGLPQPSELLEQKRMVREQPNGQQICIGALMIFRDGVKPEWEDKVNARGGHFQIQLKPTLGAGQIDEHWNNLVLATIGGVLEPFDRITGIRLVDKLSGSRAASLIRLELWFSDFQDGPAVSTLRRNMERAMSLRLDGSPGPPVKVDTKGHAATTKH